MPIDIDELIRVLPALIRENDTVKGAILSALSGVLATREDIKFLINEMDKRFEQVDNEIKSIHKEIESIHKEIAIIHKEIALMHKEIEGSQNATLALKTVLEGHITEERDGMKRLEDILNEIRERVFQE